MNSENQNSSAIKIAKLIGGVIIGIILLIAVFGSFGTVQSGNKGVVLKLNAVTGEVKDEGFYWKTPFIEDVKEMDMKIQKEQVTAAAASKDLQNVTAQIAVNYQLDQKNIVSTYQNLRSDAAVKIIQPAIQESIKVVTARYTAEELVTQRTVVRDEMERVFTEKMSNNGVVTISKGGFNLVDLDFSPSFNAAIERKVTAVQEAEAAKNTLEKIKYEAQQSIERAKGEAEAIRVKSVSLQQSPDYIEFEKLNVQRLAIDKWNGDVPNSMIPGGTVPFINLNQ